MKYDSGRELIARAIIIENGALLVNQGVNKRTGETYFALPGGHVDPGESCPVALEREMEEELEATVLIGDLEFVAESIYAGHKSNEGKRHELVLYFQTTLAQPLEETNGQVHSPEPSKRFRWLPLRELKDTNLLAPTFKSYLLNGGKNSNHPRYVFHDSTR